MHYNLYEEYALLLASPGIGPTERDNTVTGGRGIPDRKTDGHVRLTSVRDSCVA